MTAVGRADVDAVVAETRAATALLATVTGRRGDADPARDDHLRLLATARAPRAAATLVIELGRGTALTTDRAWLTAVIDAVDADPRLTGIGARLVRRFLVDGVPGPGPLLEPEMVSAILDAEAADLEDLERRMPALLARHAALQHASADEPGPR